jgi:hypothetical protein
MEAIVYKDSTLGASEDCEITFEMIHRDGKIHKNPIIKIKDIFYIKGILQKEEECGVVLDNNKGFFCNFVGNDTLRIIRSLSDSEIKQQKKIWLKELKEKR